VPQPALDQSRDLSGRELHRLTSLYAAPEWVKAASTAEACGERLDAHMYADPAAHLYPTHTKAATWLSAAYFYDRTGPEATGRDRIVEERLLKAARFNGCEPAVLDIRARSGALRRDDLSRLPDDMFAYVADGESGRERRLPLRNAGEVVKAAEWLHEYRDHFALPDRRAIAVRVLTKSYQYGASLSGHDEFLEKCAGIGGCSCGDAVALVRQRATLARARHPDVAAELEKLAALLEADPAATRRPDRLRRLVDTIDGADRLLKVAYGGAVRRPEDVLFAITEKHAAAFAAGHVPTPSGSVYAREDLARLRVAQVRDHLGADFSDGATSDGITLDPVKAAELLPTLTRRDAELFDRMAAAAGVAPAYKEAAARREGLTADDLRELAAAHRPR
jgi:hypothetical protein